MLARVPPLRSRPDDIEYFLNTECELFPAWETLPGEGAAAGEIEAERLRVCARLADARGESPELQLGLVADDVDLGDFLSQSEVDVPLDGELDLIVDLKAAGRSPRALAASLEGEFDLAIERGRVRTNLLRLTTTRGAWRGRW